MTGITGWRRATASEPRRRGSYYAALPKAHNRSQRTSPKPTMVYLSVDMAATCF